MATPKGKTAAVSAWAVIVKFTGSWGRTRWGTLNTHRAAAVALRKY